MTDDPRSPQDDNQQNPAYQSDEDIAGEAGPSGDAPERVQDVDEDAEDMGLPQDIPQGPVERGVGEAVNIAEEDRIKNEND